MPGQAPPRRATPRQGHVPSLRLLPPHDGPEPADLHHVVFSAVFLGCDQLTDVIPVSHPLADGPPTRIIQVEGSPARHSRGFAQLTPSAQRLSCQVTGAGVGHDRFSFALHVFGRSRSDMCGSHTNRQRVQRISKRPPTRSQSWALACSVMPFILRATLPRGTIRSRSEMIPVVGLRPAHRPTVATSAAPHNAPQREPPLPPVSLSPRQRRSPPSRGHGSQPRRSLWSDLPRVLAFVGDDSPLHAR